MSLPGQDKQWKGQFPGNYAGNLWQTFNIDLERSHGRIALADKMRRVASGLGVVTKFIRTNATTTDQWFALTSGDILRNGNSFLSSGTWVTDDTTGTFNDPKDGVVHEFANGEQRLLVTRDTDIGMLNTSGGANVWDDNWGSTVASGGTTLTTGVPHPVARLQRLVSVGDFSSSVPVIHTIDKDDVFTQARLSFGGEYEVFCSYASSNRFWFGLRHKYGGNARVIEWDGFSLSYNNEYDLVGENPLCGFVVRNVPYFITETGYIFKYTGDGFEVVQDFDLKKDAVSISHSGAEYPISPYGAFVDGDLVYLNIAAPTLSTFSSTVMYNGARKMRPGIWVFNTKNLNLYHWMGIGEHASAGTDVNYGSMLGSAGTIGKNISSNTLIASASPYVGGTNWNSNQTNGIFIQIPNDTQTSSAGRNRGYFITPYLPAQDAEEMFEALWLKFKKFANSNNSIVVKWRTTEPLFNSSAQDQSGNALKLMNAPGAWASTTTFTCKVPTGVSVGDEVEILSGDNSGCSFAISALSGTPDNSTLLTVTIAETAPTSSTDTFVCRFDNWKTETAITDSTIGNKRVPFTATAHGEFIQLKVELRGYDVMIDELEPLFKTKTSYKS